MAPETAPPGKSFKERWPHDASEREYLAAPWLPIVLGGLAGLFAIPSMLAALFLARPVPVTLVLAGVVGAATLLIGRTRPRTPRWILRAWKSAAWVTLAIVLGLLMTIVGAALCGDAACQASGRFAGARAVPAVVVTAMSIGGAIGGAIAVERAARRLLRGSRARAS